jgi:hypothetical protein
MCRSLRFWFLPNLDGSIGLGRGAGLPSEGIQVLISSEKKYLTFSFIGLGSHSELASFFAKSAFGFIVSRARDYFFCMLLSNLVHVQFEHLLPGHTEGERVLSLVGTEGILSLYKVYIFVRFS